MCVHYFLEHVRKCWNETLLADELFLSDLNPVPCTIHTRLAWETLRNKEVKTESTLIYQSHDSSWQTQRHTEDSLRSREATAGKGGKKITKIVSYFLPTISLKILSDKTPTSLFTEPKHLVLHSGGEQLYCCSLTLPSGQKIQSCSCLTWRSVSCWVDSGWVCVKSGRNEAPGSTKTGAGHMGHLLLHIISAA